MRTEFGFLYPDATGFVIVGDDDAIQRFVRLPDITIEIDMDEGQTWNTALFYAAFTRDIEKGAYHVESL